MRYLISEEQPAQLCLEQITRDFEFDKDNLQLKEGTLQLSLLFSLNREYQIKLAAPIAKMLEKLCQKVENDSFVYFKIVALLFKQMYEENNIDLFKAINSQIKITHFLQQITEREKAEKYNCEKLVYAAAMLEQSQLGSLDV